MVGKPEVLKEYALRRVESGSRASRSSCGAAESAPFQSETTTLKHCPENP